MSNKRPVAKLVKMTFHKNRPRGRVLFPEISVQEFEALEKEIFPRVVTGKGSVGDKILMDLLDGSKAAYHKAKKTVNKVPVYTGSDLPKPGDIIYVRSAFYIDRGEDDVVGGKATVREVKSMNNHNIGWVYVWEHPGHGYGWLCLRDEQAKLASEFGDNWAYPSPDYG